MASQQEQSSDVNVLINESRKDGGKSAMSESSPVAMIRAMFYWYDFFLPPQLTFVGDSHVIRQQAQAQAVTTGEPPVTVVNMMHNTGRSSSVARRTSTNNNNNRSTSMSTDNNYPTQEDSEDIELATSSSTIIRSPPSSTTSKYESRTISTASTVVFPPMHSLHDVITSDHRAYSFACLTGFITPDLTSTSNPPPSSSSFDAGKKQFTPFQLCLYSLWVKYLHFVVTIYIIIATFYGLTQIVLPNNAYSFGTIVGLEMFASAIPFLTMYPAVVRLRKQIYEKRGIPYDAYVESIYYSIDRGYRVFLLMSGINLASFITTSAFLIFAHASETSLSSIAGSVVFGIVTIIPSNLMLSGLFSFLLVEQRISFYQILHLQGHLLAYNLHDKDYLRMGKQIERRDQVSPINWLLITACIETALCIILLLILGLYSNTMDLATIFVNVLFVLSSFCKEILIFISMLYQIMKVNEVVDVMLDQLSNALLTEDVTHKMQRVELYIVMKEYRIGSTVMGYRPSKIQLVVQILSVVFGLLTTILKVFITM